jgi:hypothetical protein
LANRTPIKEAVAYPAYSKALILFPRCDPYTAMAKGGKIDYCPPSQHQLTQIERAYKVSLSEMKGIVKAAVICNTKMIR